MAASEKTNKVILTGLMMAIIAVSTMIIAIPVPFTNGYIHLGDSMIFLSVLILGWRNGAVAAGVGSALADLFLGYVHWAPWTFIIKGIMALLMGFAIEKAMKNRRNTVLAVASTVVLWISFNFVVNRIIIYEAEHNPAELLSDEIPDVSSLGAFLNSVQSQLMLAALLIPVFLIIIAFVIKKKEHYTISLCGILGMTLSGLFMVFGYYIAGGILYGNFAVSAFSIPMNMIQFVMGFLVAALIGAALSKTPASRYFTYKMGARIKKDSP
ncbi:MAG TPA: ECF transporter S component [Anaerovoracaceae bacterium]|nr:ECF transporter S component [Anaerovoracaceae bacterium]